MKLTKSWFVLLALALNCLVLNAGDKAISWKVVEFTLPKAQVDHPYRAELYEYLKGPFGGGFAWDMPDLPKFLRTELPITTVGVPHNADLGFHSFLVISQTNTANVPTIAKFYLTVDGNGDDSAPQASNQLCWRGGGVFGHAAPWVSGYPGLSMDTGWGDYFRVSLLS